ncbi:MAG: hypothetical protein HY901_19425 [Deltaproteobacteria bacterium]|nr:hypothetical protein [Deltaproteobacteria bacterium]
MRLEFAAMPPRANPPETDSLEFDPLAEAQVRARRRDDFTLNIVVDEPIEDLVGSGSSAQGTGAESRAVQSGALVRSKEAVSAGTPRETAVTSVLPRGQGATRVVAHPQGVAPTPPVSGSLAREAGAGDPQFRRGAIPVVSQPQSPPLELDFSEALGSTERVEGAQRIGAQALEFGEFQDKHEREALARAQAAPRFNLPSRIDREERAAGLRVVEERRQIWIWALLVLLIPTLLAVAGVFVYFQHRSASTAKEIEVLRNADGLRK